MIDEAKVALIRSELRKLAKQYAPNSTVLGEVTAVNGNTCTLDDDGTVYNKVRLQVVLDDKEGQTTTPKVGAQGLAVKVEDSTDWFLLACSEVDKWRLSIATAELEQDAEGLLVRKGNDTLKDAILALIAGVEGIVVMQGTNPNYVKIQEAKVAINNLLR